ncbi:hypothetical protein [Massilia endophytica]|uniref:hypothetical protein n=1 Tax=Massilia endophytica TaxID=2899220 RepID=UPI001E4D046D|nr:hypothetical protein [Massilia endophytica]UGQ45111.1 hypothetical protein LSQ66_15060 [Massilia endophytica]
MSEDFIEVIDRLPGAKQRFARFLEHMPRTPDPVLLVLKAHLLVEEILGDLIESKLPNPGALNVSSLHFHLKSRLARALIDERDANGLPFPTDVWPMVDALNELRNELAHKLESKKVDAKYKQFVEAVRPSSAGASDDPPLANQLAFLIGYLASIEEMIRFGTVDLSGLKIGMPGA